MSTNLIRLSSCVCLGQVSFLSVSIGFLVQLDLKFNGIEFVCFPCYISHLPFCAYSS